MGGIFSVNPGTRARVNIVAYKTAMLARKLKMPTFYNIGAAVIGVGGKFLIKGYELGETRKIIDQPKAAIQGISAFNCGTDKVELGITEAMETTVLSRSGYPTTIGFQERLVRSLGIHYIASEAVLRKPLEFQATVMRDNPVHGYDKDYLKPGATATKNITEDMGTTYQQEKPGFEMVVVPTEVGRGLGPEHWTGLARQHYRWTDGIRATQAIIKYLKSLIGIK